MDNLVAQQIPHDSAAEKAVLGAIFIDPEVINEVSSVLEPADFYEHANRLVYSALLALYDESRSIDLVTLQEELKRRGQLEELGDMAYVSELLLATPTAFHAKDYARIVHQKAQLRN